MYKRLEKLISLYIEKPKSIYGTPFGKVAVAVRLISGGRVTYVRIYVYVMLLFYV